MNLDKNQRAARDQFARQSERYGKTHILADVSDVESALEQIDLPEPGAVLDIATANGHTAFCLAGRGHHVTAADLSEAMLERCGAAARERGFAVELRCHPAEALPYADAEFDLVTCRLAAHHFSQVDEFVKESARVLKPRGWLLVIDGTVPDDEPKAEAWTHAVEKLRDPSHGRFVTPRQWKKLCRKAGLKATALHLDPLKMPDLEWYFETAGTSKENREQVRKLVREAPEEARSLFRITEENGRTVWWWQRLTLIARKE